MTKSLTYIEFAGEIKIVEKGKNSIIKLISSKIEIRKNMEMPFNTISITGI